MSDDSPSKKVKQQPRTWPQRLTIVTAFACALAAFAAAGVLYAGQRVLEDSNVTAAIVDPRSSPAAGFEINGQAPAAEVNPENPAVPTSTFPPAEPDAKNFLITGADNNSCVDSDSPYAPAFGDRTSFGERSDTIMMWRVNPATSQVAVLSFPRDLWVTIAGRSSKQRINVAYERDNPQKLIDTIYQNFGIATDHYVQVDFCAFRTLVDAVDGVSVPFDTPVRDPNTGLNVTQAGCFSFDGDHALAYVRSRKFEAYTDEGGWKQDPTADLGRISRQQDFLRRIVSRLLSTGSFNPDTAGGLIQTSDDFITRDPKLTPGKMLEFAGVMSRVDPTQITTYQIEAQGKTIQGSAVLVPRIDGDNMQAILAIFRGEAVLANTLEQVFETTVPSSVDTTTTAPFSDPGGLTDPVTVTTLPSIEATENDKGFVPDDNITC